MLHPPLSPPPPYTPALPPPFHPHSSSLLHPCTLKLSTLHLHPPPPFPVPSIPLSLYPSITLPSIHPGILPPLLPCIALSLHPPIPHPSPHLPSIHSPSCPDAGPLQSTGDTQAALDTKWPQLREADLLHRHLPPPGTCCRCLRRASGLRAQSSQRPGVQPSAILATAPTHLGLWRGSRALPGETPGTKLLSGQWEPPGLSSEPALTAPVEEGGRGRGLWSGVTRAQGRGTSEACPHSGMCPAQRQILGGQGIRGEEDGEGTGTRRASSQSAPAAPTRQARRLNADIPSAGLRATGTQTPVSPIRGHGPHVGPHLQAHLTLTPPQGPPPTASHGRRGLHV